MSVSTPIPRVDRRVDLEASAGQTVFTFPSVVWDTVDIAVLTRTAGAALFSPVLSGVTRALIGDGSSGLTVTFDVAPRPLAGDPAVTVRLESRRVDERLSDVTRAGTIRAALLEKDLDRQATINQELRRDVDDNASGLIQLEADTDAAIAAHEVSTANAIAALDAETDQAIADLQTSTNAAISALSDDVDATEQSLLDALATAQTDIDAKAAQAATSASNAATSAGAASTNASNAATSATNAANSANSAASSAATTIAAIAEFSQIKTPVEACAAFNITLSGEQTIDGFPVVAGHAVVVVNQTNSWENGIWVASAGAWARRSDAATAANLAYAKVTVKNGDAFRGRVMHLLSGITNLTSDTQTWQRMADGGDVMSAAGASRDVLVTLGDSKYGGRPGHYTAVLQQWRGAGGAFEDWTWWNMAVSGLTAYGLAETAKTGNRSAMPFMAIPGGALWTPDIYAIINADPGLIDLNLGTNDFREPASRATYGSPENFQKHLDRLIYMLLAGCPRAGILLAMPQPFAGEDLVIGSYNSNWAADAPPDAAPFTGSDAIDRGAYAASYHMRRAYLSWVGRHPRVVVWDSHKDLYGTRIDDPDVDGQDPEIVGGGDLVDDALHATDLGAWREVQAKTRLLRLVGRRTNVQMKPASFTAIEGAGWSQMLTCIGVSNSGANTLLTLRLEPQSLFTLKSQTIAGANGLAGPQDRVLDGERARILGEYAVWQALQDIRGSVVNFIFENSGTPYTGTSLSVVQVIVDADGGRQYKVQVNGVNMGSEAAGQRVLCWTPPGGDPRRSRIVEVAVSGVRGAAANPYKREWTPTKYQFMRGTGTNAIDVELRAINLNDGRLVDGAVIGSPHNTGALVASGSLINGGHRATALTLNTAVWPSGFNFKPDYHLVAIITSGTLINGGTLTISE